MTPTPDAAVPARGLLAAFLSDPGRVRTNNEDVPIVDVERGVYGVIDGVGGHAAGEVAAGIACDVILQRLARPLGTPAERVREAIAIANNEIFRRASDSPDLHGMACVVTLAIVADGAITIGHVGDTRLYKLGAGGATKLTHDHSPIGEREDAGEISETEAMRHPRRNEVFRDVGSGYRDKDEEDFVEIVTEPFGPDSAILLCTDGLTDMVGSSAIEHIVRGHAGDPQAIVEALVAAANDAGGRDNVTVVYAEAPGFARAVGAAADSTREFDQGGRPAPRGNAVARAARWVVASRTTWFAVGALTAVLSGLAAFWYLGDVSTAGPRTWVVAATEGSSITTIGQAMEVARPGDTVSLEPGNYPEAVVVGDGVNLIARVNGSATITRPDGGADGWVAISAGGAAGGRISGVRIESSIERPIDYGLRLSGQGRTIDAIDLAGPMRAGIEVAAESGAAIQGCQLAVQGVALLVAGGAQARVSGCTFIRGGAPTAAIVLGPSAAVTLKRNLFAGYGSDPIKGLTPAERQQLLGGNYVVGPEPSLLR